MHVAKLRLGATLAALVSSAAMALPAAAETEITVPGWSDYSGPYADVMPAWEGGRIGVLDWWNATKGKELGVKLIYKGLDGRYDPAQVASLWPGVLSRFKPVLVFGMGGSDYAALKTRLAEDKVPMVSPTGGYGFTWAANPWSFNLRPTLAHEAAMYVEWRRKAENLTRPLKVVIVASEAAPAWVDTVNGIKSYAAASPDKLKVTDVIWTAPQPTDLTTDVFAAVGKGIDAIIVMTNTAGAVAVRRALDNVGSEVPLVLGAHNGLTATGAAMGGMSKLTNTFECSAMAPPVAGTEAAAFYNELKSKYGLKAPWDTSTILGMSQGLYMVDVLAETIRRGGTEGLSGARVRDVILSYTVPAAAMHGFTGDMRMNNEASFPLSGLVGYCATVKNGAFTVPAGSLAVPTLKRW